MSPPLSKLREHLAKGQRVLAGEGMSQVVRSLLELMARKTYYSGDLLFSVEILRNVTDTFKRATYTPSSEDVQVPSRGPGGGGAPRGEGVAAVGPPPPAPLTPVPAALLPGGELHGGCGEPGQVGGRAAGEGLGARVGGRGGHGVCVPPTVDTPPELLALPQVSPGSVHLMKVVEDFIHLVGDALKAFQSSLIVTDNLGERRGARGGAGGAQGAGC